MQTEVGNFMSFSHALFSIIQMEHQIDEERERRHREQNVIALADHEMAMHIAVLYLQGAILEGDNN